MLNQKYLKDRWRGLDHNLRATTTTTTGIPMQSGAGVPIKKKFTARTTISGILNVWFGPGNPMLPVAPPSTDVRTFDYPFNINTVKDARGFETPITFSMLRLFADALDLVRTVIETRKDQVCKIPLIFRLKRDPANVVPIDPLAPKKIDPRITQLYDFFKRPDQRLSFQTWLRQLLEEILVIDAGCIFPRRKGGKLVALDIIDGSTIKPLLDGTGRAPLGDDPAYQQIIKGQVVGDLKFTELYYIPRNRRVYKTFGYGPVEQIVITINLAIRRQMSQMAYYTDGNIPEAIISVPDTWDPNQIEAFQSMFDALAGDQQTKRRVRFIPKTDGIHFTKAEMLKDEMDEWLARLICYCFSVSPTPFIKTVSRSQDANSIDQSTEEGLIPMLQFLQETFNRIIEEQFGWSDIEAVFKNDVIANPQIQATVNDLGIRNGSITIDEARADLGKEPLGLPPLILGPNGPVTLIPLIKNPMLLAPGYGLAAAGGGAEDDSEDTSNNSNKPPKKPPVGKDVSDGTEAIC